MTSESKPPGRPSKLNPQVQDIICQYIANGNYLSVACQAAGLTHQCYLDWLERGRIEAENGGGMYFDFLQATRKAEAEQEAKIVERLLSAAQPGVKKKVHKIDDDGKTSDEETETGGEWLAAATYLERRHPERWGRKDRLTVDDHKIITIQRVEVIMPANMPGEIVEGEARELPGPATPEANVT